MERLKSSLSTLSGVLQKSGWALILLGIAAFTLIVVRPFGAGAPDPTADDLATRWNEEIALLGISPVFPPEEDFYVGDIWAVVSEAPKTPLLGRAVRLGHLDLREAIAAENADRPVFSDTTELKSADEFRHQDELENAPPSEAAKRIRLTLAAFPGVSISHVTKAASAAGAALFGFGASRDDTTVEELRIPVAETYGVRSAAAGGQLMIWCDAPEHKLLCTDSYARRLLAYTTDSRVLDRVNGVYPIRIEMQIVTRVFMTRTIEQRRVQLAARGATLSKGGAMTPQPPAAGGEGSTPEAKARGAVGALQSDTAAFAKDATPGMSTGNSDLAEVRLQQTFMRPVVFGFRSWNVQLTPERAAP